MKVKLKNHKKSPAPIAAEQAKIESPIEILRKNAHTYVVPVQLFPDRGYRHVIDLVSRMQKIKEKTPAPIAAKQTGSEIIVDSGRRPHYWLDECAKQVIKKAKENIEKIKAEIKAEKDSESYDAFMTSEQKKQVADALVSYVLRVTDDSHCIERDEAAVLPAILDFLAETDSSKTIRSDNL